MPRRRLIFAALVALTLAATPSAHAAATCALSGTTLSVNGTTGDDFLTLGLGINNAFLLNDTACSGSPTTANTEAIAVDLLAGNDFFEMTFEDGLFEPGTTDESPGTSEIETSVTGGDGASDILFIAFAPETAVNLVGGTDGLNLNGDDDADLTYTGLEFLGIVASDQGDNISLQGDAATGAAVTLETRVFGEGGIDTITGGNGRDAIEGAGGADALDGRAGTDALWISAERVVLTATTATNDGVADTHTGFERAEIDNPDDTAMQVNGAGFPGRLLVEGSAEDDVLIGGPNHDQLYGFEGHDRLIGRGGMDNLQGGPGNDIFQAAPGTRENVVGGTGTDRIVERVAGNASLRFTVLTLPTSALSISSIELLFLTGGAEANVFHLESFRGRAMLDGGGGNDSLFGGSGNDRLRGGGGNDRMFGYAGSDLLDGGIGTDRCDGGTQMDAFTGCEAMLGRP